MIYCDNRAMLRLQLLAKSTYPIIFCYDLSLCFLSLRCHERRNCFASILLSRFYFSTCTKVVNVDNIWLLPHCALFLSGSCNQDGVVLSFLFATYLKPASSFCPEWTLWRFSTMFDVSAFSWKSPQKAGFYVSHHGVHRTMRTMNPLEGGELRGKLTVKIDEVIYNCVGVGSIAGWPKENMKSSSPKGFMRMPTGQWVRQLLCLVFLLHFIRI